MVERREAERALEVLADAGLRTERPPEQWLYKAWDGEVLVDLIFEPAGMRITEEVIERGEELSVAGMYVRVMALEDILITKLLALDEHSADYGDLLQISRALREQVEWPALREHTASSPFARAFFTLADGLGISRAAPGAAAPESAARHGPAGARGSRPQAR